MRLITRLETPAEVTNHLETCGHLTPCNGIHIVIDQNKPSSACLYTGVGSSYSHIATTLL